MVQCITFLQLKKSGIIMVLWVKQLLEFSSNTVIEFDQLFFGDANSTQDSSSCLVFVDLVIY